MISLRTNVRISLSRERKQSIILRILDTHIVFRVDFNNYMMKTIERRLMQGPKLPDVTSSTFFKVSIREQKAETDRLFPSMIYFE